MKAAIVAVSMVLGLSACNREARKGGEGGAADTAVSMGEKMKQGAEKTGEELGEATDKAVAKTKEETRQTARDVKEGAEKLVTKSEKGAKDATESMKHEAGKLKSGDKAEAEGDKQLVSKIRAQLEADKELAPEARDIRIGADKGKVKLEGTVTSQEAKTKISRIASRLAGAKNVDDGLKVAEQVGTGDTER